MDRIAHDFAAAAALAVGPGEADAVELHLGHGYLLSQWLSPLTNKRRDAHGGTATNRVRFPLRCAQAVRAAIGPTKALVVKLNTADGCDGGVSARDVEATVTALCSVPGLVDAFVPSAGFVNKNGFYMLRGRVPRRAMARALGRSSCLKGTALTLLGRWLVPELPFEKTFLLEGAKDVMRRVSELKEKAGAVAPLVFPVGGFVSAEDVEEALKQGFAGVQMARALIREPDIVQRWEKEFTESGGKYTGDSPCSHCNLCVVSALQGVGASPRCVERPCKKEGDVW